MNRKNLLIHSFRFKIFVLGSLLLLSAIGVIAYDYFNYVYVNTEEKQRSVAIESINSYYYLFENIVQDVEIQMVNYVQSQVNGNKQAQVAARETLGRSFSSFEEIFGYKIPIDPSISEEKLHENEVDIEESVAKLIKEKQNDISDKQQNLYVDILSGKKLVVTKAFPVKSQASVYWISSVFNLDQLLSSSFPENYKKIMIVTGKNRRLANGRPYDRFFADKKIAAKITQMLRSAENTGYVENIAGSDSTFFNLVYRNSPGMGLSFIELQSKKQLFEVGAEILLRIADKVALIVLSALMLGYLFISGVTKSLQHLFDGTKRIASGDLQTPIRITSRDEIGYLANAVDHLRVTMKKMIDLESEKGRLHQELLTAQTVQDTFFSEAERSSAISKVYSFYTPATECGGDWWTCEPISPTKELIVLGDATGHGVSAAIITAIAYTVTQQFVETARHTGDAAPSELARQINGVLHGCLQGKMCMSFVAFVVDSEEKTATICNAGHPFPLFDQKSKDAKRPKPLIGEQSSNILGIDAASHFVDNVFPIENSDRLIVYTDGITELANIEGKMFGTKKLVKSLQSYSKETSPVPGILEDLKAFKDSEAPLDDDMTIVVYDFIDNQTDSFSVGGDTQIAN